MTAHFRDADGRACGIPFQVAKVERPLISVSRLASAGCQVTVKGGTGDILHVATGRRLPLVRRGRVYVLEMRVGPCPEGQRAGASPRRRLFPGMGQ